MEAIGMRRHSDSIVLALAALYGLIIIAGIFFIVVHGVPLHATHRTH
jgi:hypothetical protein